MHYGAKCHPIGMSGQANGASVVETMHTRKSLIRSTKMKPRAFQVFAFAVSMVVATASLANAASGSLGDSDRTMDQNPIVQGGETGAVQAEANLIVLAFAKTKPAAVFDRVRETMADAIEAKVASSLAQAYAIAVYLHYNVTADNYRQLGISEVEYRWLESSKNVLPISSESLLPGRI